MSFSILPHFQISFAPQAEPAAMIIHDHARFTVLTPRLLRLEFSPSGEFEDHASQAFWFRRQPVPSFEVTRSGGALEVRTQYLTLRYTPSGKGFHRRTLSVTVHATGQTWHFGDRPDDNLGGTARTLDGADGPIQLEPGLVSRRGWVVADDSSRLVFDERGWIAQRTHPENLDLYFFGHGHDYLTALRDFTAVAGPVPMIPRWALGNWWSRYWEYTQDEYLALMEEFRRRGIPLSVAIIDMDWHITQTGNQCTGWTGYTWNRQLFPDPPGFLRRLHEMGLKTSLNVHPAEGVHPHEEMYAEMVKRVGIHHRESHLPWREVPGENTEAEREKREEEGEEPGMEQEPVEFDIPELGFAAAYFEVLHHLQERLGIDFWWIDWQQGDRTKIEGLDPLFWLNHLHYLDLGRDGQKRPFIFSRWPGLGGHRYPIGFSGDSYMTWRMLAFQPHFTATASNVSYGWWSHDISGHQGGRRDGELYARWVQYGLFSPILRLHSTKNVILERHPWGYEPSVEHAAVEAMRLRHRFIPYLYSMAWRAHRQSIPLVLPMYYLHPEAPEAYAVPNQYWFGSELLAAPFIAPRSPETNLAAQTVWLPEGDWFDFFSGEWHAGGRWLTLHGGLDDIPVLARAGAIVPLESDSALEVHIFPGASNLFELYEDDGETQAYLSGAHAVTRLSQKWQGEWLTFTIDPAEGDPSVIPTRPVCAGRDGRAWKLVFHGVRAPEQASICLDGIVQPAAWTYDEAAERLEFVPLDLLPSSRLEVELSAAGTLLSRRDRRLEKARAMLRTFRCEADPARELYYALPDVLAGKVSLARWANQFSEAQLLAISKQLSASG